MASSAPHTEKLFACRKPSEAFLFALFGKNVNDKRVALSVQLAMTQASGSLCDVLYGFVDR